MPVFAPIQDSRFYFNYHHTAADTLDKIVPKELAENSAVVAVAAYALGEFGATVAALINVAANGGRGGIRTHGGFPHARFRVECLKPDSATLPGRESRRRDSNP